MPDTPRTKIWKWFEALPHVDGDPGMKKVNIVDIDKLLKILEVF